jgi:hypothetical protein
MKFALMRLCVPALPRTIRLDAGRCRPIEEHSMKSRRFVPFALFAAVVAGAAHAQVRTEPPESAFVWEALGATPSLRLPQRAAPAPVAAPQTARTPRRVESAPVSEFTADTLLKESQPRRPAPATAAAAPR